MRYLKQSTSVDVGLGPFLDETDGKTAETALTITQPDIRLKKNGGAWAQKAAAQTLTHEENGWYEVTLDATDTDTIGHLLVAVHESGALPVWISFHVLAANVYDSLFGAATDKLDVNVEEWNATAVPAEHTAGYPIVTVKDGAGTGEINTNAGKVVGVELVDVLTTYTGNTPQTGDAYAIVNSGTHGNVALNVDLDAIKAKTDGLPAAPAATGDCITAAGVRSAVGLASANLDTQLADIPTVAEFEARTIVSANYALASVCTEARLAKLASLTFTVVGFVDTHVQYVNDVQVGGAGSAASPWGPA